MSNDAKLFAVARGRAAAVTPEGVAFRTRDQRYAAVIAFPAGVAAADVVALDAGMPSIVLVNGQSFHWSESGWLHCDSVLDVAPPVTPREPQTIRVPARSPAEGVEPTVGLLALRALGLGAGCDTCESGDTLVCHLPLARELVGSRGVKAADEAAAKALARTSGPLSSASVR